MGSATGPGVRVCGLLLLAVTIAVWLLMTLQPRAPNSLLRAGLEGSPCAARAALPAGDVVISFAYGYGVEEHAYFVGSLRGAGYSGAIELWVQTSKVSQDVRDYAAAMNVILREVELGYPPDQKEPHVEEWGTTLTMMVDRFAYLFQSCARYSGHCLFADFADVWFQRDPFQLLSPRVRAADLVLEAEHPTMTIGRFGYNADWVKECWGTQVLDRVDGSQSSNGGTILVKATAAVRLFALFSKELHHGDKLCNDQGMVNVAFHTGIFAAAGFQAIMEPYGTGVINTVGFLDRDKWRNSFDDDLLALQADGSVSAVVHQYQRHPELMKIIRDRAGCSNGRCPVKYLTSRASDSP